VGWVCGICGVTAEQLKATSVFRWLEDQVILRGHVMDEHQVTREDLRDTRRVGQAWVLSNGRVWMRHLSLE
jgi:hypothetical protein